MDLGGGLERKSSHRRHLIRISSVSLPLPKSRKARPFFRGEEVGSKSTEIEGRRKVWKVHAITQKSLQGYTSTRETDSHKRPRSASTGQPSGKGEVEGEEEKRERMSRTKEAFKSMSGINWKK